MSFYVIIHEQLAKKKMLLSFVALFESHCGFILSDRAVPCHIKFLRSQKVVHISCGDEHTAALTKV